VLQNCSPMSGGEIHTDELSLQFSWFLLIFFVHKF
jgi:hypothetical protein